MPYRTFNLDEVARYLHLRRADIERLVQNQDIPFERQGKQLMFRKVQIDAWASHRILGMEAPRLADYHEQATEAVREKLNDSAVIPVLMSPRFIRVEMDARTKSSIIREMAGLAHSTGRVTDLAELVEGLVQREELCSTALPGGWALLHMRHTDPYIFSEPFLVLGRTVQQIQFGAVDRKPTDLFFLLGTPEDGLHLHTLARLCLLAQKSDVLSQLRACTTREQMYEVLVAAEHLVIV